MIRATVQEITAKSRYALNGGPFGSKLVTRDYVDDGVPVIRGINLPADQRFSLEGVVFVSEDKAERLAPNIAHPGDVIFTQRGTLGQVGLIPAYCGYDRFVISQSQMKLTVDSAKADAHYVYYYFRHPSTVHRLNAIALSSGVPHINLDILRKFEIDLPPLPSQRKIAAILSAYDDLIENNTRRIAILEETASLLYREWFVDFRFPGHESVPMVDSPLGPIPAGWDVLALGKVMELCYGKALKAGDRHAGAVPVYGSSGVIGYHHRALVEGPGIIVGRKGHVGSVYWCEGDFFAIDTVYFVRSAVPLEYLFFSLKSQHFVSGDAAVPGLNRGHAYRLRALVPGTDVLEHFRTLVRPIFTLSNVLSDANRNLRQTRDLLLPRLISGEIDVEDLDIDTEGLAA